MLSYRSLRRILTKDLRHNIRNIITSKYKNVEFPKETVAEFFFRYANLYSDNVAFIDDSRKVSYTYSDTKRCINSIASALTKRGVKAGTMTGIIAANYPEYYMLILALSSMGCSVSTCNYNFTKTEIRYQVGDSNPSIIFTDTINIKKVLQVASECPSIKNIFIIDDRVPTLDSVQDLIEDNGNMSPIGQIDIDYDNHVALMPYSSGTTGLPKGVILTHRNLVSNMIQMRTAYPVFEPKTMMLTLPLYHIYASVIITTMGFLSGSRLIVQPKFDPNQFLDAIERYKASFLHLVPPQLLFLLNYPDVFKYDLSSIEKVVCGAAPLDRFVENRFIEKFRINQPNFQVYPTYGLTETSPMTHIMPSDTFTMGKQGSVGLLLPNMACKVVDLSTREELGPNHNGEILFKGPNVMKGYFGKSGETERAFEDKWFLTGDIGSYDDDQYFFIVDRIKELIKVKGIQVSPVEIEGLLLTHESISDCAIVGVPHEKFGEVPRAFVVKCKEISENHIHDFVAHYLSPHKHLLGGIIFVDQIARSPSGKILRRLLR